MSDFLIDIGIDFGQLESQLSKVSTLVSQSLSGIGAKGVNINVTGASGLQSATQAANTLLRTEEQITQTKTGQVKVGGELAGLSQTQLALEKANLAAIQEVSRADAARLKEKAVLSTQAEKQNALAIQEVSRADAERQKTREKAQAQIAKEASLENNLANIKKQLLALDMQRASQGGKFNDAQSKQYSDLISKGKQLVGVQNNVNRALGQMGGTLGSTLKSMVLWGVGFGALYRAIGLVTGAIKSAFSIVVDFDMKLVQLTRVTNASAEAVGGLSGELEKIAVKYGYDLMKTMDIAIEWAKRGKDIAEVQELTKTTVILATAAFMDENQAMEFLSATMNAFNLNASQAVMITDQLSEVSKKYAIDANELAAALQRSSFSAQEAGVSLEELEGMITTIREVTGRSGEHIGVALNTIMQRWKSPGALKALDAVNVKTREMDGSFRSFQDVMIDLSAKWGDLSDAEQQNVSLKMAGIMRSNEFLALLKNYPMVFEATSVAINANNSAMRDAGLVMDSFQKQGEKFKSLWQSLWAAPTEEGSFRWALKEDVKLLNEYIERLIAADKAKSKFVAIQVGGEIDKKLNPVEQAVFDVRWKQKQEETAAKGPMRAIAQLPGLNMDQQGIDAYNASLVEYMLTLNAINPLLENMIQTQIAENSEINRQIDTTAKLLDLEQKKINSAQATLEAENISEEQKKIANITIEDSTKKIDILRKSLAEYTAKLKENAQAEQIASAKRMVGLELGNVQGQLAGYKTLIQNRAQSGQSLTGKETQAYQNLQATEQMLIGTMAQLDDAYIKLNEAKGEGKDKTEELTEEEKSQVGAIYSVGAALNSEIASLQAQAQAARLAGDQTKANRIQQELIPAAVARARASLAGLISSWLGVTAAAAKAYRAQSMAMGMRQGGDINIPAKIKTGGGGKKELFDEDYVNQLYAASQQELRGEILKIKSKKLTQAEELDAIEAAITAQRVKLEQQLLEASVEQVKQGKKTKIRISQDALQGGLGRTLGAEGIEQTVGGASEEEMLKERIKIWEKIRDKGLEERERIDREFYEERNRRAIEYQKKMDRLLFLDEEQSYLYYYNTSMEDLQSELAKIREKYPDLFGAAGRSAHLRAERKVTILGAEQIFADDMAESEPSQEGIALREKIDAAIAEAEKLEKYRSKIEKKITATPEGFEKKKLTVMLDVIANKALAARSEVEKLETALAELESPTSGGSDTSNINSEINAKIEEYLQFIRDLKERGTPLSEEERKIELQRRYISEEQLKDYEAAAQRALDIQEKVYELQQEMFARQLEKIREVIDAYKSLKGEIQNDFMNPMMDWLTDYEKKWSDVIQSIGGGLQRRQLQTAFESLFKLEEKYLGGGVTGALAAGLMPPEQQAVIAGHTQGGDIAKMKIIEGHIAGADFFLRSMGMPGVPNSLIEKGGAYLAGPPKISGGMKGGQIGMGAIGGKGTGMWSNVGSQGLATLMGGAMSMYQGGNAGMALQNMMPGIGGMIGTVAGAALPPGVGTMIGQSAGLLVSLLFRDVFKEESKKQRIRQTSHTEVIVSSKLDLTNRELSIANRHLSAIKESLEGEYTRPSSYYFRERVGAGIQNQTLTIQIQNPGGTPNSMVVVNTVEGMMQAQVVRGLQ